MRSVENPHGHAQGSIKHHMVNCTITLSVVVLKTVGRERFPMNTASDTNTLFIFITQYLLAYPVRFL